MKWLVKFLSLAIVLNCDLASASKLSPTLFAFNGFYNITHEECVSHALKDEEGVPSAEQCWFHPSWLGLQVDEKTGASVTFEGKAGVLDQAIYETPGIHYGSTVSTFVEWEADGKRAAFFRSNVSVLDRMPSGYSLRRHRIYSMELVKADHEVTLIFRVSDSWVDADAEKPELIERVYHLQKR